MEISRFGQGRGPCAKTPEGWEDPVTIRPRSLSVVTEKNRRHSPCDQEKPWEAVGGLA